MEQKSKTARKSVVTADMHGMQAIRMGEWKLIDNALPEELPESRRKRIQMPLKQQLYKLSEDQSESIDLYDKYPGKVKELMEELNRVRTQESTR